MNMKELRRNKFRTRGKGYFMLCDWQEEGRVGKGGLKLKGQGVEVVHALFIFFIKQEAKVFVSGLGTRHCEGRENGKFWNDCSKNWR